MKKMMKQGRAGKTIELKPTPKWGKKDDKIFEDYFKSLKDK